MRYIMKLNDIIFPDRFPSLDLHGYDREISRVLINDFIDDNVKMGNEIVVIIHGKGSGIIKDISHMVLNKNPKVVDFKTDYFNDGCTIVQLSKTMD